MEICPTAAELSLWKDGLLDPPHQEMVATHVDLCAACLQSLVALEKSAGPDALLDQLKKMGALTTQETVPESLSQKLAHLKTIPGLSTQPFESVLPFAKTAGDGGYWGSAGVYQLLAPLACGGMSLIFLGRHENSGDTVALKFLKPDLLPIQGARDRFRKEARVMASLHHSHLVPILDSGEVGGLPFLVMPLLTGETLAERLLRENPLPIATVLKIGREVCLALAYLHDMGLVHRDIKPSNLWVQPGTGEVLVGDLGIVLEEAPGQGQLTTPGTILGTPGFQAPEIIAGHKGGAVSDLFSLGSTLFETLTGRSPFSKTTWPGMIEELALKKLPRASLFRPEIPKEIDDLLAQLLEKDPDNRPRSAQEVAAILDKCLARREILKKSVFPSRRKWMRIAGGFALGLSGTMAFVWERFFLPPGPGVAAPDKLFGHNGRIESLVFSPDGSTLFSSGGDGLVSFWDWKKQRLSKSFRPDLAGIPILAISPNGKSLGCLFAMDRVAKIFQVAKPEEKTRNLFFQRGKPLASVFHPANECLAIGVFDDSTDPNFSKLSTFGLTPSKSSTPVHLGVGRINTMVFHPEGEFLFIAMEKNLESWSIKDEKKEQSWRRTISDVVKCLLVSPDGQFLFAASESGLFQYTTTGTPLEAFQGDLTTPLAMSLLNNGKTLAVLEEKALSLWDIPARKKRARQELPDMDPLGPVAFHPQGQVIAYASGNTIRIEALEAFNH